MNEEQKKWLEEGTRVVPLPTLPDGWTEFTPPFLPSGHEGRQRAFECSVGLNRPLAGVIVLMDCAKKLDGRFWLHVSFSRRRRMPSYEDITEIKRLFIGEERRAIFVLPPKAEHVNIHNFCLHLWACEDDDGLPNFAEMVGGAQSI